MKRATTKGNHMDREITMSDNDQNKNDAVGEELERLSAYKETTQAGMDHIMEFDRVSKLPVSVLLYEISGHLEQMNVELAFIGKQMEERNRASAKSRFSPRHSSGLLRPSNTHGRKKSGRGR